jgi:hypothetical protein
MEGWTDSESLQSVAASLKGIAPDFYRDLVLMHSLLPAQKQVCVKCATVQYGYGSLVMSEGVAVSSGGREFPGDLCIAGSTPFGVVTKGTLDVVDGLGEAGSADTKAPMSTAQLKPGALIGAFEGLDKLLGFEEAPLADWTIYSGVNCIEPTVKLATAGRHKTISRLFEAQITQHDMGRKKLFGQVVAAFGSEIPGISEWHSEVVYFNLDWYNAIYTQYESPELERVALRVRDWIYRSTWDAISVTRNIHSASKKYFYGTGVTKGIERRKINQAYRLFVALVDLFLGRSPIFKAQEHDDERCPSGSILSGFLLRVEKNCGLMQPSFIYGSQKVGYIPFAYLLPELLDGASGQADALKKIKEGLSIILSASQRLKEDTSRERAGVPLLRNFSQIIDCLQVRTAGESGAKNHAKLKFAATVTSDPISEESFFSDVPNIEAYKRWRHFNHCLKIDLSKCQWP